MKKKTINAIICKKFDQYLASIKDEEVKKLVNNNSIITGGCIASMLLKEQVNDFDIYFTNKETVLAVANYYTQQFNELNGEGAYVLDGATMGEGETNGGGVGLNMTPDRVKIIIASKGVLAEEGVNLNDEQESLDYINTLLEEDAKEQENKPKYRPVFLSCNAITLSDKIQIVIRFYGEPSAIHDNYDYIHCTNYWSSKDRQVHLNQEALESLLAKELVYIGSKYPIASVIRSRKFINRGWTINAGQFLKMSYQISELNLEDVNVLEDQLVGVDVVYFSMLIDALKETTKTKKEKGEDFKISYSYISTIINKIF